MSASAEKPPRRPTAVVVALLASTLGVMAGAIVSPIQALFQEDLGINGTQAGLVVAAHGLVIALVSPLIGRMIDRYGTRFVLAGGLLLYGLAGGAGMLATDYPILIATRIVFGVGAAAVFGATTLALLSLGRDFGRDRIIGLRSTFTSAGGIFWPLAGGTLGAISWHAPFALYLVAVPLGFAALLTMPAAPIRKPGRGEGGAFTMLRRRPALVGFYGLQILSALFMYTIIVFVPQRLAELGVIDPVIVAVYSAVTSSAVASLVGLLYKSLRARISFATILRVALASWVVAFLILATVDVPTALLAGSALSGLAFGLVLPSVTILINDTAPPEKRGRAAAISGTANFSGQFLSPVILGPLAAATSLGAGFMAVSATSLIVLLVLLTNKATNPIRVVDKPSSNANTGS